MAESVTTAYLTKTCNGAHCHMGQIMCNKAGPNHRQDLFVNHHAVGTDRLLLEIAINYLPTGFSQRSHIFFMPDAYISWRRAGRFSHQATLLPRLEGVVGA
jgi:hypothetical protein